MDKRYVYFACRDERPVTHIKIGLSRNPSMRLRVLRLQLLFAIECDWKFARQLEYTLHKQFDYLRIDAFREPGRWATNGSTEWFRLDPHLRQLIWIVATSRIWPWDRTQRVIA